MVNLTFTATHLYRFSMASNFKFQHADCHQIGIIVLVGKTMLCYGVSISNYLKNEDQIILFDKKESKYLIKRSKILIKRVAMCDYSYLVPN